MSGTSNHSGRRRRIFVAYASIILILIIIGIMALILKANEILNYLAIVFTILGVVVPFLFQEPVRHSDQPENTPGQQNGNGQIEDVTKVIEQMKRGSGMIIVSVGRYFPDPSVSLTFGFDKAGANVDVVAPIEKRQRDGRIVYTAIFSDLPIKKCTLHTKELGLSENISIHRGVNEVNWRSRKKRQSEKEQEKSSSIHLQQKTGK